MASWHDTRIELMADRKLLSGIAKLIKADYPDIRVHKEAIVTQRKSNGKWDFCTVGAPYVFRWYGAARNTYHARYLGWSAWLENQKNYSK